MTTSTDQNHFGSYEQDGSEHYSSVKYAPSDDDNGNVLYDDDLCAEYIESGSDGGLDPGVLLAILENAVDQHHGHPTMMAISSTNPEELPQKREDLEQTWKAIRTYWLWAHETREQRSAAAYLRGAADLAPLHLICKLTNNPPTDILNEIVHAAPEVAAWADSNMWIPLHHACINGASTEVLKLLISTYPKSKGCLDGHNRTPLHLYATRGNSDNYNPLTMATNFSLLCSAVTGEDSSSSLENLSVSAAEVRDVAGMIPMHYACAYGTAPSVLQVLEEAYPQSINAKDNNGRTPLHFVMVNAQRTASPGVLRFLLGWQEGENGGLVSRAKSNIQTCSVNVRDDDGHLPLHKLNIGLNGSDLEQTPEKLDSAAECLKLYLAAEPSASTDFLAALQALPDLLRDVAVVSPHVRNILNKKIIQRFPTSILMLDGIMLVIMIVAFELATTRFIDQSVEGITISLEDDLELPLLMLYTTAAYFFLRELIQVIASLTLGAFTSWLYDTTNWLDVLVITLVTYYSIIMAIDEPQNYANDAKEAEDPFEAFRSGTALTKGVLWTAVIFFLKSTQVDFAVFLNGVFYVVHRLVAFLLAILVILISFAQMFWVVYLEQPVCRFSCGEDDIQCKVEMEGCAYPHCEFGDSFLKVYTMMMGEIGTETRYDENLVAQILYIFYGFFIVILLSNVLIAIVTDSYEVVQNDRAAIVFWSNRLDFVAEMDGIASVVRRRIFCAERTVLKKSIASNDTHDDQSQDSVPSSEIYDNTDETEEWLRQEWDSVLSLFEPDVYGAAAEDIRPIDFWIEILKKTVAVVVIPPWLIFGFVTVGILWPPQVREWLFVQVDSVASRAEIERRKLEQLQQIQHETKLLKDEMRMEMKNSRDEMFRTKAEVDAVQEEVLADLQQVSVLVSTLLSDLGGLEG